MASSFIETYSIDSVLDAVIRDRGLDRKLLEQRALLLWYEVAGPEALPHAQPVMVGEGVIHVTVSDAVWLTELNFRKASLIRRLNAHLGAEVVQDIRFRVGGIRERHDAGERRPYSPPASQTTALEDVCLEPALLETIDQIVAEVTDEELQASLRRILVNQAKLSKLRAQEET